MEDLKKQFEADMFQIYKEAAKIGYKPHLFLQMITESNNIIATARQLIQKDTYGFSKLYDLKRLDLSVEFYILKDKYHTLFTDEDRVKSKDRLEEYGFDWSKYSLK